MTLKEICDKIAEEAPANCPEGFVEAVQGYMKRLYGDKPEDFDGPDEIKIGNRWLNAFFIDYDKDHRRGTLSLLYSAGGELKASCEVVVTNEYAGVDSTIEELRNVFMK